MSTNQENPVSMDTCQSESELMHYKRLYHLAPVAFFTLNSEGVIVEYNDYAPVFLHREPGRILNHPLQSFFIEGDTIKFEAFLNRIRDAGTMQSCELSLIGDQIPRVMVVCTGNIARRPEDNSYEWFIALIDTWLGDTGNSRVHHEQNISFIADLIEHTTHPFAVAYPNGQIWMCNTSFETLLGYSTKELSVLDWARDLTPDEWKEHERTKLNELHRTGKPVQYEKEYIRKDGTRIPVELFVHLVSDTHGTPQYYYSFISDITERKKIELQLKESEERFLLLADNVDQVFWFTSLSPERVLYVNPAFERIWGVPTLELYKDPRIWTEHIHPDDRIRVADAFTSWIEGKSPHYDIEYCILTRHGKIRWIHDRGVALLEKSGVIAQVSGIAEDITHLKLGNIKYRQGE